MNYELNKNEFEKLKREELAYIDSIAQISNNKTLSETEKLEIYRTLNNYEIKLNEILKKLRSTFPRDESLTKDNLKDVIIEIDLPKDIILKGLKKQQTVILKHAVHSDGDSSWED